MASADPPFPLDAETRELIRLLKEEAIRCRDLILNPPGGTDRAQSFNSSRAASKLKQINQRLKELRAKVIGVTSKKVRAAYESGLKVAEEMLAEAGVTPAGQAIQGNFTLVDTRRAELLLQQTVGDVVRAVDSIERNTGKLVKQCQALGLDKAKINRLLAGGTVEGAPKNTLRQLKEEIRKVAIDGKIVTVNRQTGVMMFFQPDDYAELVYQTKLAETTNVATVQRLSAKGVQYVKIIGSNSRNPCTAFLGRVFYIGEGDDPRGLYPHLRQLPRGGPPFHPRCTKRVAAFVIALATPAQIESGKLKPNELGELRKRFG